MTSNQTQPPTRLPWPDERANATTTGAALREGASNLCLDLHGDVARARLVVFADGNHHMALADALAAFRAAHPAVADIFYATTPPPIVVQALAMGSFVVGNLSVSVYPHVFISPPAVLDALVAKGAMAEHAPLAASRGLELLVRKGNPRGIRSMADLARADVRLFLPNPAAETPAFGAYVTTLLAMADAAGITLDLLGNEPHPRVHHGRCIHHREAPQALADGQADAAVLFHHLALRYERVFGEYFERVPLTAAGLDDPAQQRPRVHIGVVGDGGTWGARLVEHMRGAQVAAIYRHHGLVPAPA